MYLRVMYICKHKLIFSKVQSKLIVGSGDFTRSYSWNCCRAKFSWKTTDGIKVLLKLAPQGSRWTIKPIASIKVYTTNFAWYGGEKQTHRKNDILYKDNPMQKSTLNPLLGEENYTLDSESLQKVNTPMRKHEILLHVLLTQRPVTTVDINTHCKFIRYGGENQTEKTHKKKTHCRI
mgnify:CR=1 FL=1